MGFEGQTSYPSHVAQTGLGRSLIASGPLEKETAVALFAGPRVAFRDIPDDEVKFALLLEGDDWIIPDTAARFINHSCEPNCRVDDSLEVVTLREVASGEDLTVSYNRLTMAEYLRAPECYFWDPRWSFACGCGSARCVGNVDRYIISGSDNPPVGSKVTVGAAMGKGRGVFARERIRTGEIFERAPVIVSPGSEWVNLEKTVFYHYCFGWGPQLEHAAVALGYGSLYSHSYQPNAVYIRRLDDLLIDFQALRDIEPGEEITVNYNNDPTNQEPVWFELAKP